MVLVFHRPVHAGGCGLRLCVFPVLSRRICIAPAGPGHTKNTRECKMKIFIQGNGRFNDRRRIWGWKCVSRGPVVFSYLGIEDGWVRDYAHPTMVLSDR